MEFIDEGSVVDSPIVDEDIENNDVNESNCESHISTSRTRKSKEISIKQIKGSLLPPMPPLLDDVEPSPEPAQTQLKHSSRAGTPESISFVNNNDKLSIESL